MLKVYSTKTCRYCPLVKRYLKSKGAVFEEIDVTNDVAQRMELQRLTGMSSVPVTIADNGKFSVGWKVTELNKLIN